MTNISKLARIALLTLAILTTGLLSSCGKDGGVGCVDPTLGCLSDSGLPNLEQANCKLFPSADACR